VSGLPALSVPAGFTADGLPIGMELLGRPLSDAKLVSFAYDYETSVHPRRAPPTTPALIAAKAPSPRTAVAKAAAGEAAINGRFAFDPTRRSLSYDVSVTGAPAARVYAISIDRDTTTRKGPALRVLSGPGVARAKGSAKITEIERQDLVAGRTSLVLYSAEHPFGIRAPIRFTP
jgi:hypothetical protein